MTLNPAFSVQVPAAPGRVDPNSHTSDGEADGSLEEGEMTEQLLTPSKITAFLDCAHYLTCSVKSRRGG